MKNLLLAKSNIRKSKGLSICISLLILICATFMCVSGLLLYDYNDNASDVAKRLKTTEYEIASTGKSESINKEYIDSIIPDTVKEYYYIEMLNTQTPIEFNNGEVTPNVNIINKSLLDRELSKIEILEEDKSITDNYVYIPYHIHTGGGINMGDTYKIKVPSKTYKFKVKGYINSIYAGSYNMNKYEMLVSDETYEEIKNNNPDMKAFSLFINYKKNVKDTNKESNKIVNRIFIEKNVATGSESLELTLDSRTFISMIFFVSFLMTSVIIIGIVMLMIYNNISNYIRENVKSLGVLKAMGYTTRDIKKSLLIQFSLLTFFALAIGVGLGYLFMPSIADMLIAQSGIPYTVKFNLAATLISLIIPVFVFIIVILSVRKIKKLEPIVALRDGIESHNFKKNHVALSKSKLPLNLSLSFKNIFKSIKQNVISFVTVLFLCFLMVISMAMYQNFSRKPNLSLLTFEIVDGVIQVDKDIRYDFEKDLKEDKNITKYKYLSMYNMHDKDYTKFLVYILEDPSKLNNKDSCYEGRYPKHDNEVAISGKYAKNKDLKIGDEIKYYVGDKEYSYLITGFIQSTNNDGREAVLLYDGAKHIMDIDNIDPIYYFDSNVKASKIIKKYNDKYKDKIVTTLDFEELIKGQMDTFINVANLMVVIMSIISGCIIILVLYLLMKTLIYTRRYEYGVLKALGYKSKDLILQNVLSFLPTIIVATLVGTIVSYYVTNPYIGLMMRPFGIMKCTMEIPLDLLVITVLFIIGISTIAAILMSLKIRKIEPCDLLRGE